METLVKWYEWGKEAFEKAEIEGKPVLLTLTATWCHWCHVHDKENYSDKEVADFINNHFIPIKVDIDQRPDIKERYNLGGFPTIAFLNWYGESMGGGTYQPKDQFMNSLHAFLTLYKTNLGEKKFNAKSFSKRISAKNESQKRCLIELDKKAVNHEAGFILSAFDPANGGFGTAPKFPMTDAIDFCFDMYSVNIDAKFMNIIKKTLDGMKPLMDEVEGGFFRYSTSKDWSEPHYEKMLETNAGLLSNYARGFKATENPTYKKVITKILSYVNNNLLEEGKAFYGSQDADETYYNTSMAGRKRLTAPAIDKTFYVDWNAKMISAYLEASEIMKDEVPKQLALNAIHFIMKNCYDKQKGMFHMHRLTKENPGNLADNAYMIKALLDAHKATSIAKYLEAAERLMSIVVKSFSGKTFGFFDRIAYSDDIGSLNIDAKPLAENSVMAMNLIRLSKLLGKEEYKELARKTLLSVSCDYEEYGIHGAIFGKAVKMYLEA